MTLQQLTINADDMDGVACDMVSLQFLASLIVHTAPKIIVEAGTYRGHFALTAARVLESCGYEGMVYTADPKDYGWQPYIRANGVEHRIRYLEDDFLKLVEVYPEIRGKVDLAFIDSGPIVDGPAVHVGVRYIHWANVVQWMAPKGLVVVDDMDGDWYAKDKILAQSLLIPGRRGLAMMQRR